MATDNPISAEHDYARFWVHFQLFPISWINTLVHRPRIIYFIFLITYGAFLLGKIIDSDTGELITWQVPTTFRPWIGEVFIGDAELHFLTIAVLPVAWAFVRWTSMITTTFEWLRAPIGPLKAKHGDFDTKYLAYLHTFQERLQSKSHSGIASFSMLFIVMAFLLLLGLGNVETLHIIFSEFWASAIVIFFLIWAYFMGIGVWPIFVTMQFIQGLSDQFYLEIRPSHPDKCGGLKPLGDFCFAMSLPVILGGLVLAFVGVVGLALSIGDAGSNLYSYFELCTNCLFNPFSAYLSLTLWFFFCTPLMLATFFVPLWNIHQLMLTGRRKAEDEFAVRVSNLEEQIRSRLDSKKGLEEAKIAKDKLDIIKVLDPNTTGYPTWPFRSTLVIALFSPQIFSIGGFILSIYEVFK